MNSRGGAEAEIVQLTAFLVGPEEYVVDIMRVREIIKPMPVTPVRRGPEFVEGVINLRGSVIPIVDLRRRFGLKSEEHRHRKVIIMTVCGRTLGVVVDGVTEVVRVPRSAIKAAPTLLDSRRAPYFMGVCTYKGRTLVLLNVKSVVETDDVIDVPSTSDMMGGEL